MQVNFTHLALELQAEQNATVHQGPKEELASGRQDRGAAGKKGVSEGTVAQVRNLQWPMNPDMPHCHDTGADVV